MTTWATEDVLKLERATWVLNQLGYVLDWEKGVQGIKTFLVRRTDSSTWKEWRVIDEAHEGEWVLANIVSWAIYEKRR